MAKRFTDNEKWKDAWFMDLPAKYKLFWLYLLDECNHAGIWKVNFKVASFYIGEHLEFSEVKRILNLRITILNDNYWYINKFIKYQYKCEIQELNTRNKAHLSVLKILNEYDNFKPLVSPSLGVKDKDKDKDKDKVIIKDIDTIQNITELNKNDFYINEDEFLKTWNDARKKLLKKESNISKLSTQEKFDFNLIKNLFTKEQFKDGMRGLFMQKDMFASTILRPKHFLSDMNIEKYIDAFKNDNQIYQTKNKFDIKL